MIAGAAILSWLDAGVREITLFAAFGFLLGGIDDLALDLTFLAAWRPRRAAPARRPAQPRHFAIFVAAWDEAAVIGAMLRTALTRLDHADFTIHVGAYPNDPGTIAAVAAVAATDPRVRLVVGERAGPSTKADCLNTLWSAMRAAEGEGARRADAIVLHDAEDVVHARELAVFETLLDAHDVAQLPVLPLIARGSRLVSGHYADEFAESHAKNMVVRAALGVGMPLAGVGCAVSRGMLDTIAATRGGVPFDAASLTEDYELGLMIASLGGRAALSRERDPTDGSLVAVRAYFPATIEAAVRQKARWMIGIALAGWDRVGWGRTLDWREHWMRMRDRRAPIAMLVLATAYLALITWAIAGLLHWGLGHDPAPLSPAMRTVLRVNAVLLLWRVAWRIAFTGHAYGWREAVWAVPRLFVSNVVALLAARRALFRYVAMLRGAAPRWDKTRHVFPDLPERGS